MRRAWTVRAKMGLEAVVEGKMETQVKMFCHIFKQQQQISMWCSYYKDAYILGNLLNCFFILKSWSVTCWAPHHSHIELLLIHLYASIPRAIFCFCLTSNEFKSAVVRFQFLRHFFRWAIPVDPSIALHAMESLLKGLHHGMSQLLGL